MKWLNADISKVKIAVKPAYPQTSHNVLAVFFVPSPITRP